jgi:hypothetical protein
MTTNTRLLQLHLLYRNANIEDDDVIVERVAQVPATADPLYCLTFSTHTSSSGRVTYRTYFNRRNLGIYLQAIVDSLGLDDDPFRVIQVSSSIFPSFMYRVEDLNWDTRATMMDMIMMSLSSDVARLRS